VSDRDPHRNRYQERPSILGSRLFAGIASATILVIILALGEMTLRAHSAEREGEQRLDTLSRAAVLRAKLERELSSLLFLSSGLASYLTVRHENLQAKEITDMLAVLHRSSRHIRNFGIAVGYRLTYIYPVKGNEQAIGLYYPDQPGQWPVIRRIIDNQLPALAGPVDLIQGGRALLYRVPLFIEGRYWGLLSTAIDSDAFFSALDEEMRDQRYRFAIRGVDGQGIRGAPIWGDDTLFDDPGATVQELDIPGGRWALSVKADAESYGSRTDFVVRLLAIVLGTVIAWMTYALIRSRGELTRLALYDELTGLPNRNLFEDRAEMAFARQHRSPDQLCAILFVDLDGFKSINDDYGHKAGDDVLRETAARARSAVRSHDTVARWGGDEFIILLENITRDQLEALMARLRVRLESPIEFEGKNLSVGVSMGLAIHPETGAELDDTLRLADQKMYEDKQARRAPAR
jgi:diguanylate cyclase (GGDEF)-like protein